MSEKVFVYAVYALSSVLVIGTDVALLAHTLEISIRVDRKPEHLKRYARRRRICWLITLAQALMWFIVQSMLN